MRDPFRLRRALGPLALFGIALGSPAHAVAPAENPVEAPPLELIDADPGRGFEYPFLLALPARLAPESARALLVEPNNTGRGDDDLGAHLAAARELASRAIGADVSRELGLPLLVPVFPRPATDWERYTHALDSDTLRIDAGPMRRLDLQLLAMVAVAKARLGARGIALPEKILLTGFSASGSFVNRFTALHPERVLGVAGGGLNGILIVPRAELAGLALPYPIGIADLAERVGAAFDLETWKRVPQRYYMGAQDENDAVQYDDAYTAAEKAIVDFTLGARMQPDRWERCQALYREAGANVSFRTYAHAGHFTDGPINRETIAFFRTVLAGEPVAP